MAMIQIRNVPDDVHRTLKSRAASEGRSLSDYLLQRLRIEARQPTLQEVFDRLSRLPPVQMDVSAAEIIREERERRADHLDRVIDEARARSRDSE